ncbi:MAG: carbon starvation protein A [Paludibacteraceae bacterium]|nr:carbon starvation protein A [Paludibacteraceae bacterium]
MITFSIALLLLIVGYFAYGALIERLFAPDASKITPTILKADGVDYVPMSGWRMFMIQFLNIAGLGPIFGAIMGAKFGMSSYLWIVLGTIFGGAVHDYLAGMISLRNDGCNLPEIHGKYLGNQMKQFSRFFAVLLMILVGAVFVAGPAELLGSLTPSFFDTTFWIIVIFLYYFLATMLPIDKIIGKIYPLFAFALLFMAVGILVMLYVKFPALPEITDGLANTHPGGESMPIFPMMFISIACGAISGFHATQSPLMARCMTNEKQGRRIFFGAMIAEGIIALIWATAATYFFQKNGMGISNAAEIVNNITKDWLGTFGGLLAILGVIAAPITSGDTALRSARLMISDMFNFNQKPIKNRLLISAPLFLVTVGILLYSLRDKEGFNIIWRYFAWANQTLAVMTLWTITVYLLKEKKCYWVTLLPALFMTSVVVTYILVTPEGLALSYYLSLSIGIAVSLLLLGLFFYKKIKNKVQ